MNKYNVNFHYSDKDYFTTQIKAESDEEIFTYFTKRSSEGIRWINIKSAGTDKKLGLVSTTINFDKVMYYTIEQFKADLYERLKDEDFLTLDA